MALIGHGDVGKTTFACMCRSIGSFTLNSYSNYLEEAISEFMINDRLPQSTKLIDWDIGRIERETLFNKCSINFIDCAGQLQKDIFEELKLLARDIRFKNEKIDFGKPAKNILTDIPSDIIYNVLKSFNKPISQWIDILPHLEKLSDSDEFNVNDTIIPKLFFLKIFKDANKLILAINGDWLQEWENDEYKRSQLFAQFNDYSDLLYLKKKNVNKVALMITKGYLFGIKKANISNRPKKDVDKKFKKFLEEYGTQMKKELNGVGKWKSFFVGVPSHPDDPQKHAGKNEIFGVEELINWLL